MSSYPLYVTFTEDSNFLDVNSVSYSQPTEGYWIKIEEDQKWKYFGAFGPKIQGRYYIDWYVGTNGYPAGIPSYELEDGIGSLAYFDDIWKAIANLVDSMMSMHEIIGDVWKLPDPLDCFLYALTEASEVLESILLQVRSTDSRNSKQVTDYETHIEMFDVTMMLFRGLMALYLKDNPEGDTDGMLNWLSKRYKQWSSELIEFNLLLHDGIDIFCSIEPEVLSKFVNNAILSVRVFERDNNQYDLDELIWNVFAVMRYVMFHPVVEVFGYNEIAEKKLLKILNKNLLKRAQIVN